MARGDGGDRRGRVAAALPQRRRAPAVVGLGLALVAGLLLIVPRPAAACSCQGVPLDAASIRAAAPVVKAQVTAIGEDKVSLAVERSWGAPVAASVTHPVADPQRACAFETSVGQGMLVSLSEPVHLCRQFHDVDEFLDAVEPGRGAHGPIAFLSIPGPEASARAAYDRRGALLSMVPGPAPSDVSICPGGSRAVGGGAAWQVLDIATMTVVDTLVPPAEGMSRVLCLDEGGTLVAGVTGLSSDGVSPGRLVWVRSGQGRVLYEGPLWSVWRHAGSVHAAVGAEGTSIVRADLAASAIGEIGSVPDGYPVVTASPDGTWGIALRQLDALRTEVARVQLVPPFKVIATRVAPA